MEWDSKMLSWGMADVGPINAAAAADGCLGMVVGHADHVLDCSVDLKLGGLGEFVPSNDWKQEKFKVGRTTLTSSSKRARAASNGGQIATCLVEGCKADLSKCRDYHRRHKVCEVHSKTPVVIVGGQEQRFCQQCSRFHMLVEFDEVKRSCRKRLDGHNRRRRKPQPDSLNSGSFFTNHQGTRFSLYPQIFSTSVQEPKWASTENGSLHSNYTPFYLSTSSLLHSKQKKQFPFLSDGDATIFKRQGSSTLDAVAAVCQPLKITPESSSSSSRNNMVTRGGLNQVFDTDCALSLLSSPTPTPANHLGQMLNSSNQIPVAQHLVTELDYSDLARIPSLQASSNNVSLTWFSCPRVENKNLDSIMPNEATDTGIQYQGLYRLGNGGQLDRAGQALPFSW